MRLSSPPARNGLGGRRGEFCRRFSGLVWGSTKSNQIKSNSGLKDGFKKKKALRDFPQKQSPLPAANKRGCEPWRHSPLRRRGCLPAPKQPPSREAFAICCECPGAAGTPGRRGQHGGAAVLEANRPLKAMGLCKGLRGDGAEQAPAWPRIEAPRGDGDPGGAVSPAGQGVAGAAPGSRSASTGWGEGTAHPRPAGTWQPLCRGEGAKWPHLPRAHICPAAQRWGARGWH